MTDSPSANSVRSFALTVLGPVPSDELGVVYPHEHLLTGPPSPIGEDDPDLVLDVPAEVIADLLAFRAAGGRSVVELTTPDYGRDVAGLAQLSRETGVNIIATTGLNKARYSEGLVDGHGIDHFTARFVAEVREGVGSLAIRCGIVKLGTSLNEVRPTEETVTRAAARTYLETGCPITTHTERGTLAETQLDILASEGAPPSAVTIGHLDFCDDIDVLRRVAERGAYLEFDQIPKPKYHLEATVIERLVLLVDEGFESQLLVSGDFSRKSYFGHWTGGPGMDYLLTVFRDRLATALTAGNHDADAVLDRLFVRNPRSALSFRGPGWASTAAALGWT
jgi:phosphotriesterase-related protein